MSTLYVISAPAGEPDDLTRRALRILKECMLVVTEDEDHAQQLLDYYAIATPLAPVSADAHLEALTAGDVALLCSGLSPAPSTSGARLVRRALDLGIPVVPAPGPSLAITALLISGLPADSFFYLGELPEDPSERRELLSLVRAERRSLLALAPRALLPAALADLPGMLGDRPLALVASSAQGAELVWRGSCADATAGLAGMALPDACVLVIGGAPAATRWDEARLRAEIERQQAAGLGAKEISQRLAEDSGWSRREIYQRSIALAREHCIQEGEPHAR